MGLNPVYPVDPEYPVEPVYPEEPEDVEDVGDDDGVTRKAALADSSMLSVAVTVYVPVAVLLPRSVDGTENSIVVAYCKPTTWAVVTDPTFVEPKVTLTTMPPGNPDSVAVTDVPAAPWEGLNTID